VAEAGAPAVDAIAVGGQHGMVVPTGRHRRAPGQAVERHGVGARRGWLLKQLPDGAAGWAAACGTVPVAAITITKLSWLHRRGGLVDSPT
jgi:xylulokinase